MINLVGQCCTYRKSCPAFSSMVIRSTRSFTRSSTGSEAFLYGRHSVSDLAKDFVAGMLITLAIAVVANRNVVKTFCFLPDRFRLAMFIAKVCNNVDRSCESPSSRSHDDYLYFLLRSSHRNEVAMAPEKDPSLSHEAITQNVCTYRHLHDSQRN